MLKKTTYKRLAGVATGGLLTLILSTSVTAEDTNLPPESLFEAETTNVPPDSVAEAQTNAPARGPGRLVELQQKAEERDKLADKCKSLEDELVSLQQRLGMTDDTRPRAGRGRLDSLERKAAQFEQVVLINEAKTEQIRLLVEENDELRLAMTETEEQYTGLRLTYDSVAQTNLVLQGTIDSLHQTIDQLLLGNFEYYEIREPGETLASIAGLPMVYGDTNKANLLIAPNRKRVPDLKNLQNGDVLVIPRFPASGKYLW